MFDVEIQQRYSPNALGARSTILKQRLEAMAPRHAARIARLLFPGVLVGKRAQIEPVFEQIREVFISIMKLLTHWSRSGRLSVELAIEPGTATALIVDSMDVASMSGMVRFDLVLTSTGGRLTEVESVPSWTFALDDWCQLMSDSYPENHAAALCSSNISAVLGTLEERGIEPGARCLILTENEAMHELSLDFMQTALERRGFLVEMVRCEDFSLDRLGGYDFVHYAFYADRIEQQLPGTIEALRGKVVWPTPGFEIIGRKDIFAMLWREANARLLTPSERLAIEGLVPKTYRLTDLRQKTAYENQHLLVLKPRFETMGKNVFVGKLVSPQEWLSALEFACRSPNEWIVQDHIGDLPIVDINIDGTNEAVQFDFAPYALCHRGQLSFHQTISRLSRNHLFNTTRSNGYLSIGNIMR